MKRLPDRGPGLSRCCCVSSPDEQGNWRFDRGTDDGRLQTRDCSSPWEVRRFLPLQLGLAIASLHCPGEAPSTRRQLNQAALPRWLAQNVKTAGTGLRGIRPWRGATENSFAANAEAYRSTGIVRKPIFDHVFPFSYPLGFNS
jgi:hypothetical protein